MNTIKKITRFFTTPRNDWSAPEFSARGNGLIDLCHYYPEVGEPLLEERTAYWKDEYRAVIKAETGVLYLMTGAGIGFLATHSIILACSAVIAVAALLVGLVLVCRREKAKNPDVEPRGGTKYWKSECHNIIQAEIVVPYMLAGAVFGFLTTHVIIFAFVALLSVGLMLMCRRENAIRCRLRHFYDYLWCEFLHPEYNQAIVEKYYAGTEWGSNLVEKFAEACAKSDADAIAEQKKFDRIVSGFGTNYTNTTLRN